MTTLVTDKTLRAWLQAAPVDRSIGDGLIFLATTASAPNHVFTSSFCFKVRDDVKQGALTLQRLNRHLQDIRFGSDTFRLEWDWVPRMQKVQEFFEAVESAVEGLEHDCGSIFTSPRLTDEQRATAEENRSWISWPT